MTHLINDIYAIEVPEGAINFEIKPHLVRNAIDERDEIKLVWESQQITHNWLILPPGNWQLICTTKEATWTQTCEVVETQGGGWKDYNKESIPSCYPFTTPFESLRSLLTSKGLDPEENYMLLKKQ